MFINHPDRGRQSEKSRELCEKKIVEVLAHYQVIGAYRRQFQKGDYRDWTDEEIKAAKFVF